MTVLQFADNNILFLNNTDDISSKIQSYLTILLMLIGLKIYLSKITIIGMGRDLAVATQIALDLGCRIDNFQFVYLGIPLGGRLVDCSGWDPIVDMFMLSQWKCRHLFMRNRLTLIKSVLCYICFACECPE